MQCIIRYLCLYNRDYFDIVQYNYSDHTVKIKYTTIRVSSSNFINWFMVVIVAFARSHTCTSFRMTQIFGMLDFLCQMIKAKITTLT